MKKPKVLLGMSGGVDSSVSAILLKEAGYEVIGATMKLWAPEHQSSLEENDAVQDAKKVCEILQIPHYTFDLEQEFRSCVMEDFISCYQKGLTPNPCIECNQKIKFKAFYEKAKELDCQYIATGHYAKREYDETYQSNVLKKSNAVKKDQTYFLYRMSKEVLEHVIFPLEKYEDKEEIRKIAKQYGLPVASKSDSQEICFIPDQDYASFLQRNMKEKPKEGKIVDKKGKVLGKHKGLIHYTIGQRKGLGIAYSEPLYVLAIDSMKNEVIVGSEKELYQKELYATDLNFLLGIDLSSPIEVMAKVRYRAKEAKAIVTVIEDNLARVEFEEPQRAITKGQSVVFYLQDIVLGGGKIK